MTDVLADVILKRFLHGLGFNIFASNENKIPVDENGRLLTGGILQPHQSEIPEYVLKSPRWGIRFSTDSRCDLYICIDWDEGPIPDILKPLMWTTRKRDDHTSYHAIIKVTDANRQWLAAFAQKVKDIKGHVFGMDTTIELFAKDTKKNFIMFGNYKTKGDDTPYWFWKDSITEHKVIQEKKILEITKSRFESLFPIKKTTGTIRKRPGTTFDPPEPGNGHDDFHRKAVKLAAEGLPEEAIIAALKEINKKRANPHDEKDIERSVRDAVEYVANSSNKPKQGKTQGEDTSIEIGKAEQIKELKKYEIERLFAKTAGTQKVTIELIEKLDRLDPNERAEWIKTVVKQEREGEAVVQTKEPNADRIEKVIIDIEDLIRDNMMAKMPEPNHAQIGDTIMRSLRFAKLENEQWDELMISEKRTYVRRGYTVIKNIIAEVMPDKKSGFRNEVTKYIGAKVPRKIEEFDKDHKILNFKNCFYNWDTGEISTDPEYYDSMVQIDTEYRPELKELQEFLDFMQNVMPDEERRNGLLEGTGLVFLRTLVNLETAIFLVGSGANGKSTFLDTIQVILGDMVTANITLQKLETRFQAAEVHGKFAIIENDIPREPLETNDMYNKITSRNQIQGEVKRQNPFYFKPFCILLFAGNNLPDKPSYDEADTRRDLIFEFTRTFKGAEKNLNLKEFFATEENKSKILNTLLKYAKKVLDQGKLSFEQAEEEKELLYKFRSSAAWAFVKTRLRIRPDGKGDITDQTLYQEFGVWCTNNGRKAEEKKVLKEVCKKCGFIKKKKPGRIDGVEGRFWNNMIIRKKDDYADIEESVEDGKTDSVETQNKQ